MGAGCHLCLSLRTGSVFSSRPRTFSIFTVHFLPFPAAPWVPLETALCASRWASQRGADGANWALEASVAVQTVGAALCEVRGAGPSATAPICPSVAVWVGKAQ